MFTKNIKFKNFIRKKNPKTNKILRNIIKHKALLEKYPLLKSFTKKFQYSYKKKKNKKISKLFRGQCYWNGRIYTWSGSYL